MENDVLRNQEATERPQDVSGGPPEENSYISATQVWSWFNEARDKSTKFRQEADLDCDYYDNDQWTEEERTELKDRGQPDTTINRIKPSLDLIFGTEIKLKVDYKVAPIKGNVALDSGIATECIKHVVEQNEGDQLISEAFQGQVKAGWKIIEVGKNEDPFSEPVEWRILDRDELFWDPMSKKFDLSDAKYIIRPPWVDVDEFSRKFPKYKSLILSMSQQQTTIDYTATPYQGTEDQPDRPGVKKWDTRVSELDWLHKGRNMVRPLECWYKVWTKAWVVEYPSGEVEELNPSRMVEALTTPMVSISKKLIKKVRLAIVLGPYLLRDEWSEYQHNRYPFVPFWGFRADKDKAPYGIIRQMRDPQDEINKRRSKAMHLLNSTQIIATSDAIDQKVNTWKKVVEQITDPQGVVVLNANAGPNTRFEVRSPLALVEAQYKFEEEAKREIEEVGMNREMQGLESNATSGRAIIARQVQGNTMLGPLLDNYRKSRKLLGQLTWSGIQQYWTKPKVLRITDKIGGHLFINLNEKVEENGTVYIKNDVTRAKMDVTIDEQAFNATVRQTLADEMFALVGKLPPEVGLLFLDEIIDMIDLPNKDRLIQKIQMAQGLMQERADQEVANQAAVAEAGKLKAVGAAKKNTESRSNEENAMRGGLA